jgi:acetyl-CoA synthetase
MIPVASIMTVDDIVYRFQRSTPKVVITDRDNVDKIEAAMAIYENEIPVKILLDDAKENWYNINVTDTESNEAVASVYKRRRRFILVLYIGYYRITESCSAYTCKLSIGAFNNCSVDRFKT